MFHVFTVRRAVYSLGAHLLKVVHKITWLIYLHARCTFIPK